MRKYLRKTKLKWTEDAIQDTVRAVKEKNFQFPDRLRRSGYAFRGDTKVLDVMLTRNGVLEYGNYGSALLVDVTRFEIINFRGCGNIIIYIYIYMGAV